MRMCEIINVMKFSKKKLNFVCQNMSAHVVIVCQNRCTNDEKYQPYIHVPQLFCGA